MKRLLQKLLPLAVPAILFLTIYLTWLLLYPYQLWAKEANGFFAWTHDYFAWISFQHLPLLTTVAGDLLTQLFRFPAIGALVQAILALLAYLGMQLLLRSLRVPRWLDGLSLLAALYIWYRQFTEESLTFTLPAVCYLLLLAAVVALISRYLPHRTVAHATLLQQLCWLLLLAGGSCLVLRGQSDRRAHLQFLTATQRWEALSRLVGETNLSDNVEAPYLLLSLSQQGMLGDYLFHYPVNTEEYFLYAGSAMRDTYFFNQHFYAHLGLWNEAIHMAYQEKTRTRYPMSFRVLMSLIRLETARGDYRQANKYLDLLDRASFYHTWVQQHRPTPEQLQQSVDHSTDATFFITDSTLKNLHYAATIGHGNEAVQTYYLCALLIRKNLLAFVNHLREHPEIIEAGLPTHFWEALILADAQGFHIDGLQMFPGLYERFTDFQQLLGRHDRDALLARYQDTYWFNYYFLTFPDDENPNPGILRREQ